MVERKFNMKDLAHMNFAPHAKTLGYPLLCPNCNGTHLYSTLEPVVIQKPKNMYGSITLLLCNSCRDFHVLYFMNSKDAFFIKIERVEFGEQPYDNKWMPVHLENLLKKKMVFYKW